MRAGVPVRLTVNPDSKHSWLFWPQSVDAADVTRVLPSRQKLMGLKLATGKAPGDTHRMNELKLPQGQKIMMLVGEP
jgi:hypothetical protein